MGFDIHQVIFVDSDFFHSGVLVCGYRDNYFAGEYYSGGSVPQEVFDFIVGKIPYEYRDEHVSYACYSVWSERVGGLGAMPPG